MDNEKLESLEEKFIRKEDLEEEKIGELIEEIRNYATVDKNGFVKINHDLDLSQRKIVWLVLSVRYLANKLQSRLNREDPIRAEMKASDIAEILKKNKTTISARLKELYEDGRAEKPSRGVYRANPHKIKKLLEDLKE